MKKAVIRFNWNKQWLDPSILSKIKFYYNNADVSFNASDWSYDVTIKHVDRGDNWNNQFIAKARAKIQGIFDEIYKKK